VTHESSVKVFDLPLLVGGAARIQIASLPGLWNDLAGGNVENAYRAQCRLVLAGPDAIRLLEDKLRPVCEVSHQRLAELLRALDHKQYAVRQKASVELEDFGESAAPALRRALENKPNLELRLRIEALLAKLPRDDRALEVLETLGGDAARHFLEKLAGGMPDAQLTRHAKSSLYRLTHRATLEKRSAAVDPVTGSTRGPILSGRLL